MSNPLEKSSKPSERVLLEVEHGDIPDVLRRLLDEERKTSYGKKITIGMTIFSNGKNYQFAHEPDPDDPGERVWVMRVSDQDEKLEKKLLKKESDIQFLEQLFRLREES